MKAQAGLCSVAQCIGHSLELSSSPCPQQHWAVLELHWDWELGAAPRGPAKPPSTGLGTVLGQ